MRPDFPIEIALYDKLQALGVTEAAVLTLGEGKDRIYLAGRWVSLQTLGTRDLILATKHKAIEVLAIAQSWEALDVLIDEEVRVMLEPVPPSLRTVVARESEIALLNGHNPIEPH